MGELCRNGRMIWFQFLCGIGILMTGDVYGQSVVLTPQTVQLGTTIEGMPLSGEFKVENSSKDTIRLGQIQVSCGCTSVASSYADILPGGNVIVTVKVDTKRKKDGPFKSTVVLGIEPKGEKATVELQAYILRAEPSTIDFGEIRPGVAKRKGWEFPIMHVPGEKLEILNVEYNRDLFEINIQAPRFWSASEQHVVQVAYAEELKPGKLDGRLKIVTNRSIRPSFEVALRGRVLDLIECKPQAVSLGVMADDTIKTANITVYSTNEKDFNILALTTSIPDRLSARLLPRHTDGSYEIAVETTAQSLPKGEVSETLDIAIAPDKHLKVPIFGLVLQKGGIR
jgi:hypothetical protein